VSRVVDRSLCRAGKHEAGGQRAKLTLVLGVSSCNVQATRPTTSVVRSSTSRRTSPRPTCRSEWTCSSRRLEEARPPREEPHERQTMVRTYYTLQQIQAYILTL
jgi:hypothetical protein